MSALELSTPYDFNVDEYNYTTHAYTFDNWVLGYEYQKESFSLSNEYLITLNDEFDVDENNRIKPTQSVFDIFETVKGINKPDIVKPTPSSIKDYGVDSVHGNEKDINELFKEAYSSCEATDISQIPINDFINYCEDLYNMKTDFFLEWFEKRNHEGNVDMQMWAQYARYQQKNDID